MKLLAAKIQIAESIVPIEVIQIIKAWTPGLKRFQVNIQIPIKTDSMKNANKASIASGAPNTSPMKREYSDQFIPNWNS